MQAPPPPPQKNRNVALWIVLGLLAVCGCGVVPVIAAILFPVFAQAKLAAKRTATLSNSKQAALAVLMYSADWNDRLPRADQWMDATMPYSKNDGIYKSLIVAERDALAYGFAFRKEFDRKKIVDFPDPTRRATIFDSTLTQRNATGGLDTLPVPGRYQGANIIAFLDGHAKATKDSELKNVDADGDPMIR